MDKHSNIITDFHTHLLPDLDCSGNPEISAQLLKQMHTAGIQNVVLTPHFYPERNHSVTEFLAQRDRKIKNLVGAMSEMGIADIALFPAAEVLLCPHLDNLEDLCKLCIEGTNSLLVEMPDLPWVDTLYETLKNIREKLKLDVVIAHADRYGKKEAMELIKMGFKVQVNTDSTVSFRMKKTVLEWAKSGYVYALGSDKHVHSDKNSYVYKEFPKAVSVLSQYASVINERSLKLIGK